MSAPRVTVLMPVYNGERDLREALESILRQTFTRFEFLIINDGSTDSSVEIIQSYADTRIRLVHNDRNLGLVDSLNRGLELSRGEFVARMDADDISRVERLERQVRFMDENPRIGVCGSWVRVFSESGARVWKLPASSEAIRCEQFLGVGVAHPTVMMRRQLFADHLLAYDPGYRHIEDYELWVRALRFMDFGNIQEVLLDYRTGPAQISTLHRAEQLAAVAPLRVQRVRELGIEPTPAEQELHEMILNGKVPPDRVFLDRAEQWLLKLEAANKAAAGYHAGFFSRLLFNVWFSTCVSVESTCSLRRCLGSPLFSGAHVSTWQQLRGVGAWVLQKRFRETVRGPKHV